MEEFLKTVARHYLDKVIPQARQQGVPDTLPFSRYLFCFPNRRSSLFFSRYLQTVYNEGRTSTGIGLQPVCMPPVTTIGDLYGLFSNRHLLDRTALLFKLYNVYSQLSKRREPETFDQFVFWGDMLLSDFDDVDRYLVNADQLFANVRDLKEIDARFAGLSDEQIAIIRSFWFSFQPENQYPEGEKHEVFGQTWAILADVYHAFRRLLDEQNEAYAGMMEREVVEHLSASADADPFASLPYEKVVFVGLTAVSQADRRLMSLLKLNGHAEFCWDYADPRLQPQGSKATSAAFFSKNNLSDFGNELSDEELRRGIVPEEEREVKLYSVASGVGQTALARRILQHWKNSVEGFDPFRTAVVLPDEKLLLPMLYAVPEDFDRFNVTMGYSLRNTPVAAFVAKLAALQQSWRPNEQTFYFRQVLPLLSDSFTMGLSGTRAADISKSIVKGNKYQVSPSEFAADKFLLSVFRPISSAIDAIAYVKDVLDQLTERAAIDIALTRQEEKETQFQIDFDTPLTSEQPAQARVFNDTDYEFLYHYSKILHQLEEQVRASRIVFTPKTLFMLLEKLVAGVSVPFKGEPFNGLQVMGVLETRSLDFDNVIILSMNEGVFPAKPSQNTFVPMSLRDAFGMPTQRHRDSVFAYHFYRLIGRARRLSMIYDSRSEGMQTGEESRYVKQLKYLMGHPDLKPQTISDDISILTPPTIVVRKTPEIMELLQQCVGQDGTRNFSASVLKDYIKCPLKFYLRFVRQLNEDDDVTEGVDSALFGDILHDALRRLYLDSEGKEVQKSMLQKYVDQPAGQITTCVKQAFKQYMHIDEPQGYNLLIMGLIVDYVTATLRHDMQYCPFKYLKGEGIHHFLYDAGNGLQVRIKCIYDRVDQPLSMNGTVRIVDYKTGNSNKGGKLSFSSVEDLFTPDGKGSTEAFQVMTYSLMMGHTSQESLDAMHLDQVPEHVAPHLYFVRDFQVNEDTKTSLTITGKPSVHITDFAPYREEFGQRLSELLCQIFNPEIPFTQCEHTQTCEYCDFANLCNRKVKK